MVGRKRTSDGIPAVSSLNLGIIKKGKLKKAEGNIGHTRSEQNQQSNLEEIRGNGSTTDGDEKKRGIKEAEKLIVIESNLTSKEESANTNNLDICNVMSAEEVQDSPLKLISCDYGSSSGSSSDG